jgi:hypothetical protein
MSDEMKLLRAFIEASGYEVKEDVKIETHEINYMQLHGMTQEEKSKWTSGASGGMVSRKVRSIDYKVTKKEQPIEKIDIYLYTYLEINKDKFIGASMNFYEIEAARPKDSYSELTGVVVNQNPVIADCHGRFPEIFIEKPYKVIINDRRGHNVFENNYK